MIINLHLYTKLGHPVYGQGRAIFEKEESHRHEGDEKRWKTREEGRGDETVRHRSYTSRPSGEDKGTVLLSSATIVPWPIRKLLRFTRCNNIFSLVSPSLLDLGEPANLCRAALNGSSSLNRVSRARKRVATGNGVVPCVTTPRARVGSSPWMFSLFLSNCARTLAEANQDNRCRAVNLCGG